MSMIETILEQVRKTNPEMTREKLINEMGKSDFSAKALVIVSRVLKDNSDRPNF